MNHEHSRRQNGQNDRVCNAQVKGGNKGSWETDPLPILQRRIFGNFAPIFRSRLLSCKDEGAFVVLGVLNPCSFGKRDKQLPSVNLLPVSMQSLLGYLQVQGNPWNFESAPFFDSLSSEFEWNCLVPRDWSDATGTSHSISSTTFGLFSRLLACLLNIRSWSAIPRGSGYQALFRRNSQLYGFLFGKVISLSHLFPLFSLVWSSIFW